MQTFHAKFDEVPHAVAPPAGRSTALKQRPASNGVNVNGGGVTSTVKHSAESVTPFAGSGSATWAPGRPKDEPLAPESGSQGSNTGGKCLLLARRRPLLPELHRRLKRCQLRSLRSLRLKGLSSP